MKYCVTDIDVQLKSSLHLYRIELKIRNASTKNVRYIEKMQ